MLPSNFPLNQWPKGGEIDIMEFIGKDPFTVHGALHYGEAWNNKGIQTGQTGFLEHIGDEFRAFAIEKSPNSISWYVDNDLLMHVDANDIEAQYDWPFEATFHIILNLAVGGNWPGYPNPTTEFPNTFEVDYLRVYSCTALDPDGHEDTNSGTCHEFPQCKDLGLVGECCPTPDGTTLDCCEAHLCHTHAQCSSLGLEGACCPTSSGVFLDCCTQQDDSTVSEPLEQMPEGTCDANPQCKELGLEGNCCPTINGVHLECCKAGTSCQAHSSCI